MSTEVAAYPLTLDAIVQRYPGAPSPAVDSVTLEIAGGELVALLGPSGCGKTTLLRIIAGFIEQTEGKVVVGDKRIDDLPPNRREVGIVFQNYALFPHMTVADNVAYGLAARGVPQAAQRERVEEMLALVQMAHLAGRFPRQMSGGHASCFSTSPLRRSTRTCGSTCRSRSSASSDAPASPASLSRTTRKRR